MATLTETAYYTRRAINWAILTVITYIILRISWSIIIAVWLLLFPPQPPPPNHLFGKLPAIKFPAPQSSPSAQLTFRLETIEGSVPRASDAAAVYFMPKPSANLLALNRTQDFADRLGFDPTPKQDTKNLYHFDDPDYPLRKLRYDIVTNNFILRYGYEFDTSIFTEKNFPNVDAALAEATSTLQTYGLYVDDLANGTDKVTYLKLVSDTFIPTTSLSQADSVRIDFFRQPVGGIRVFTPYPNEGPVSIVYSGSNNQKKKLLQFAYTFWQIDYETVGTYPLKTSTQAWQELQSGIGFTARYPQTGTVGTVRQVYLGYYDSFDPQTYLQPIFVFEGDNGFLAYVPAVSSEWIEQ